MSDTHQGPSIDELSHAVRNSGGELSAQNALWRATFDLERWYFVITGTMPDVSPFVGVVDEVPSLLAFTTAERARDFALGLGRAPQEANQMMGIPTEQVIDLCERYIPHGVQRLVVDQGVLGFFAPLAQVRAIHDYVSRDPNS